MRAGDLRERAAATGESRRARVVVAWLVVLVAVAVDDRTTVLRLVGAALAGGALILVLGWLGRPRRGWPSEVAAAGVVSGIAALFAGPATAVALGVVLSATVVAYGAIVRWSVLPRWPRRRLPTAKLTLGPLLAALLVWTRAGSLVTVGALLAVAMATLELYARWPAGTAAIDAAIERLALAVSRAVATLLSDAVMVLVILPLGQLSRLFRYSPLDGGWSTPTSAWVAVDSRRLRQPNGEPASVDSMAMLELAPTRQVRRRGRLRMVPVVLSLVGLAVVLVPVMSEFSLRRSGGADDSAADSGRDTFTRPFEEDPAFADAPWARTLRLDLLDTWENLEFNAALGGWQLKDASSEYINVTAGERATLAPDPELGEPITIWFFGGSAAFGAGQRDEHTIPSELVRLAAADGIALDVRNLAVPATVNWQSAMLLIGRLQWDPPPDLVVFYDGANDVALQGTLAAQGKGSSDRPASLIDAQVDEVLRERGRGSRGALPPVDPVTPDPDPTPAAAGGSVLSRYRRGVELIRRFCDDESVPVSFFWQPDLRAKAPRSAVDEQTLADSGVDDAATARWRELTDVVRGGLGELGVTDLSAVFDGDAEPVYWDTVHTNERGAQLAAQGMYGTLASAIQNLHGRAPR